MRKKLLISVITVATAALALGVLLPAKAAVPPSIEGGDFYQVKNLTKGSGYANTTSADKCDELQYRIQIHNPGPDSPLNNVTAKATIPATASTQNVSTATVSASNASPASVSDTATANLASSLKVTYVPGSTLLLNAQGGSAGSVGDITSGVSIGNVGISINEQRFIVFKAKVDCPETPPPVKNFVCTGLTVTNVNRTTFKFTATASVQNVTIQNYVFTAKNSSGASVDTKTVTTSSTSAEYTFTNSTPGTYTVNAVVNTSGGATNPDSCMKQVTVTEEGKPTPPPTTPPAPTTPSTPGQGGGAAASAAPSATATELPATGPTGLAGIFVLVTTISSVAYYLVTKRSL